MDNTKDLKVYTGPKRIGKFCLILSDHDLVWRVVLTNGKIISKEGDIFEGDFFNYKYFHENNETMNLGTLKMRGKVVFAEKGKEDEKGVFEFDNTGKEYKYKKRICGVGEWRKRLEKGEVDEDIASKWEGPTRVFF